MAYPEFINSQEIIPNDPSGEKELVIVESHENIIISAGKIIGKTLLYSAISSIGRKAIFTTALYFGASGIISTVGLIPTTIIGTLVWLL